MHKSARKYTKAPGGASRAHSSRTPHKPARNRQAPPIEKEGFPMRINKYLARHNHGTRRAVDELIEKGQVFINGRRAVLGDKVEESDKVDIRRSVKMPTYANFAYNKPKALVTLA